VRLSPCVLLKFRHAFELMSEVDPSNLGGKVYHASTGSRFLTVPTVFPGFSGTMFTDADAAVFDFH
jgi:hypothetical protein